MTPKVTACDFEDFELPLVMSGALDNTSRLTGDTSFDAVLTTGCQCVPTKIDDAI
jgi:hypothetical protein